jgi:hypothetical protein
MPCDICRHPDLFHHNFSKKHLRNSADISADLSEIKYRAFKIPGIYFSQSHADFYAESRRVNFYVTTHTPADDLIITSGIFF